jgi:6-pyruvoyl-tetrahydropterin synthase
VPTSLTFYDFTFRAKHALKGRAETAAHPHWHTYVVRFWFNGAPDQDGLSEQIEAFYQGIHGSDLNDEMEAESTDEGLAEAMLKTWAPRGCVRVTLTNDGRRGAEVCA